jgi:hypothetical protein
LLLLLNALVNLLAVNGDVFGGPDAQPYLVAAHTQHSDLYLITDVEALPDASGQKQQSAAPLDHRVTTPSLNPWPDPVCSLLKEALFG